MNPCFAVGQPQRIGSPIVNQRLAPAAPGQHLAQVCRLVRTTRRDGAGATEPLVASLRPGRTSTPLSACKVQAGLSRLTLRKRFLTACKVLGRQRLESLTIHHGRHTFISPALASGDVVTRTYNAAGYPDGIEQRTSGGGLVRQVTYTSFDNVGNPLICFYELPGPTLATITYSYDDSYQIVTEQRTGASPYYHTHVYDPVGNRLVVDRDGYLNTYTYDEANQLVESGRIYTYDGAGNMETWGDVGATLTRYTWDGDNHLTLYESLLFSTTVTMVYDADGREVSQYPHPSLITHTHYTYDGAKLLREINSIDVATVYTNQPGLVYGGLISTHRSSGSSSFMTYDILGSASSGVTAFGETSGVNWLLREGYRYEVTMLGSESTHYRVGAGSTRPAWPGSSSPIRSASPPAIRISIGMFSIGRRCILIRVGCGNGRFRRILDRAGGAMSRKLPHRMWRSQVHSTDR